MPCCTFHPHNKSWLETLAFTFQRFSATRAGQIRIAYWYHTCIYQWDGHDRLVSGWLMACLYDWLVALLLSDWLMGWLTPVTFRWPLANAVANHVLNLYKGEMDTTEWHGLHVFSSSSSSSSDDKWLTSRPNSPSWSRTGPSCCLVFGSPNTYAVQSKRDGHRGDIIMDIENILVFVSTREWDYREYSASSDLFVFYVFMFSFFHHVFFISWPA